MLLILRSKLWGTRSGRRPISGSGASTQDAQSNSGNCLWYSALTHKLTYFGSSLKKLIEGEEEPLLIPSITGDGRSQQAKQQSNGRSLLRFVAEGVTAQRQRTQASARQIPPVSGSGSTLQEVGWGNAQAEQIDVELEVFAAILAVV